VAPLGRLLAARQRMQHIDRVADIQALTKPERHPGAPVQEQLLGMILRSQDGDRIGRHLRGTRHLRHKQPIRPAESQLSAGVASDLIALFVNSTMVAPTEQGEVRERSRSSLGPVADVMALTEADFTARKATTVVAMVERAA